MRTLTIVLCRGGWGGRFLLKCFINRRVAHGKENPTKQILISAAGWREEDGRGNNKKPK